MKNITAFYTLSLEGNDINTRAALKLQKGDLLKISRLQDEQDTFEILICTQDEKELGLLSYPESVGIAPYIDGQGAHFEKAQVEHVNLKPGKTRAQDQTFIKISVDFLYDENILTPHVFENDIFCFLNFDNCIYAFACEKLLGLKQNITNQTHLNRYVMECALSPRLKTIFDICYQEKKEYIFCASVLFSPDFLNCKINAEIAAQEDVFEIDLDENEKQALLEFINHERIFNDEAPVFAEIDQI